MTTDVRGIVAEVRRSMGDDVEQLSPSEKALWKATRGRYWGRVIRISVSVGASISIAVLGLRLFRGLPVTAVHFVLAGLQTATSVVLGFALTSSWLRDKRLNLIRSKRLRDAMLADDGSDFDIVLPPREVATFGDALDEIRAVYNEALDKQRRPPDDFV